LEAVLLKGLAKKPDDRFASARELEAALAACRDAAHWSRAAADAWWREQGTAVAAENLRHANTARIHEEQTMVTQAPLEQTSR
jgi:serine/threonine-protein kinase